MFSLSSFLDEEDEESEDEEDFNYDIPNMTLRKYMSERVRKKYDINESKNIAIYICMWIFHRKSNASLSSQIYDCIWFDDIKNLIDYFFSIY